MSNFPKPDDLEALLEKYSEKLEEFGEKFNPNFSQISVDLKAQADHLRSKIEKYANFSRDAQLEHLLSTEIIKSELEHVYKETKELSSKFGELEKMFRFKQNLE